MAGAVPTLATGAGAAGGLETLYARMRAEEQLRNQGRAIDIDEFNAGSLDTNRRGVLGENIRQFDAEAPTRAAQVTSLGASARENNANAGLLEGRGSILKGLSSSFGAGGGDTGSGGGVTALDNPAGRLRLSLGGIPPNSVFENETGGEATLDAYARKIGKTGRNDLTFDERNAALKEDPRFKQADTRIQISQDNLGIRQTESQLRQRKMDMDIRDQEAKFNDLQGTAKDMAMAEFRDRIAKDVKSKQTWTQWFNGESVPDPSAQIAAIAADVMGKYHNPGRGNPNNPAGNPPAVIAPGAAGGTGTGTRRRYNPATGQIE